MPKADFMKSLLYKQQPTAVFNFDALQGPGVLNYFMYEDIATLNKIATSVRYSSKPAMKRQMIKQIMESRGFKYFAGGTNRVVYKCLENPSIVAKIAIDKVGMGDNPAEMRNQHILKPFVAKCFDCSPDGVIAICERVYPITTLAEFETIAPYIYDIIVYKLLGKYVVDDIGSQFFLNWGIREGQYPCLLDYPYVFELDDKKMTCNNIDLSTGIPCLGEIDYDIGFNFLKCTKCGKVYKAFELGRTETNTVILKGDKAMKVAMKTKDGVVRFGASSDYIEPAPKKAPKKAESTGDISSRVRIGCSKPVETPKKTKKHDPIQEAKVEPKTPVKSNFIPEETPATNTEEPVVEKDLMPCVGLNDGPMNEEDSAEMSKQMEEVRQETGVSEPAFKSTDDVMVLPNEVEKELKTQNETTYVDMETDIPTNPAAYDIKEDEVAPPPKRPKPKKQKASIPEYGDDDDHDQLPKGKKKDNPRRAAARNGNTISPEDIVGEY